MDYMKYRVEAIFDESNQFIGNGRVGVGIRIKAEVETTKKGVNLGSIISDRGRSRERKFVRWNIS